MGQHLAIFHFAAGGLWVRGELLGESWWLEREGYGMLVSLPSEDSDFGPLIGDRKPLTQVSSRRGKVAASVRAFQIAVPVKSTVSSKDPLEADKSDGERALNKAYGVAFSVAEDFLSWLRVLGGQYWLLASHEPPRAVGTADLIDVESGGRVRNVGLEQRQIAYARDPAAALTRETLDQVVDRLARGEATGSADLLFADAQDTLAGEGAESELIASRRDVRRAVLLAAIAAELKIKETLREKTPAPKRALVELMLKKWREVNCDRAVASRADAGGAWPIAARGRPGAK
jgi:hypothetical protein